MNCNGENNNSIAEPEFTLQVASYNSKEFVEAELALETESWMNNLASDNKSEKGVECNNELANN